jgi:predicted ATPase
VERVGEAIAQQTDVLCFDEFAVTTIQDCCILMPLFSSLFESGVTVVATSNRSPDDLYTDGLNRHIYLPPFLEVLRQHCKVHHLESTTDYRSVHFENSADAGVFCWPPDREFLDRWLDKVTGGEGGKPAHVDVSFGRTLAVPQLSDCGRVARFSFDDLCMCHLSADDYLKLCRRLHTILLDDVPLLTVDNHNEARRFTTFVDSCYEHHVRLICSMEGSPEQVLGPLSKLRDIGVSNLGGGSAGAGDGDTTTSGVMQAIGRIKKSRAERAASASALFPGNFDHMENGAFEEPAPMERASAHEVLSAEVARVKAHGSEDVDVWRQGQLKGSESKGGGLDAPPQVSKAWDDRRRISQFTWESMDPTSEQQSIKGVFTAAVASLKESGFAVDRCISRLREMQTDTFQHNHRLKHLAH